MENFVIFLCIFLVILVLVAIIVFSVDKNKNISFIVEPLSLEEFILAGNYNSVDEEVKRFNDFHNSDEKRIIGKLFRSNSDVINNKRVKEEMALYQCHPASAKELLAFIKCHPEVKFSLVAIGDFLFPYTFFYVFLAVGHLMVENKKGKKNLKIIWHFLHDYWPKGTIFLGIKD